MLALTLMAIVPLADTPYSSYTDMTFGSSPSFQTVARRQIFTESGWCKDKDTYLTDGQPGTQHLIINTALDISCAVTSGEILSTNNGLDEDGKATRTYVIRAHNAEGFYKDTWTFTDTGTIFLVKDEDKRSENGVEIKDPPPSGNGGSGGGS